MPEPVSDYKPVKVSNDTTDVKDVEKNATTPQIRYDIPLTEKHNKYQTFHLLKLVQLYLAILILIFEIVQVIEFEAYFQDFKNNFDYVGPSANSVYFHEAPFGKGPVAIWNYVAIVFTIVTLGVYLLDIKRILPHTKHVIFMSLERTMTILWMVETLSYLVWAYDIQQSPCYADYPVYYYSPTRLTKVLGSPSRRQIICGAYITATSLSWLMLATVSASTAVAWLLHDSENEKLPWPLFMLSALIPKSRDLFYTPQSQPLNVSPPLMGTASDEIKRKGKPPRKSRNSTSPRSVNSTSTRPNKSKSSRTSNATSPPSWMAPATKIATNIASHVTSAARQNNDNNNILKFEIVSNIPSPQLGITTPPIGIVPNTSPQQNTAAPEQSNNNVATETANNNTPPQPNTSVIPPVDNDKATQQQSTPAQSNDAPIEMAKNDPPPQDKNTGSTVNNDTPTQQNEKETPQDENKTPQDENKTPQDENKTPQNENKTPEQNNDVPVETASSATSP